MLKRWLVLLLALAVALPRPAVAADVDTDLATGVRQAQEGDFENAVTTLDSVVRRLTSQPARAKDLARAYTYLSIAYLGLSQEQTAKAKFLEAWKADSSMELSPREFPPRILEFFEQARKEAGTPATTPRPAASPRPAAAAPAPAAEEKKGGSKTVPILIGAAVLGGVGVAVAAGGGGDDGGSGGGGGGGGNDGPTGPLTFRLSWSSADDLDLFVVDPSGFAISWQALNSPSGGSLSSGDVGCGPSPQTETTNWTSPPRGTYTYWAAYPNGSCSTGRPTTFTLTVSRGNSVVATQTGTLNLSGESAHFSYVN
jgi:hypothetical protein